MFKLGEIVKVDKTKLAIITKEGSIYYKVEFNDGTQQMVMVDRISKNV